MQHDHWHGTVHLDMPVGININNLAEDPPDKQTRQRRPTILAKIITNNSLNLFFWNYLCSYYENNTPRWFSLLCCCHWCVPVGKTTSKRNCSVKRFLWFLWDQLRQSISFVKALFVITLAAVVVFFCLLFGGVPHFSTFQVMPFSWVFFSSSVDVQIVL